MGNEVAMESYIVFLKRSLTEIGNIYSFCKSRNSMQFWPIPLPFNNHFIFYVPLAIVLIVSFSDSGLEFAVRPYFMNPKPDLSTAPVHFVVCVHGLDGKKRVLHSYNLIIPFSVIHDSHIGKTLVNWLSMKPSDF